MTGIQSHNVVRFIICFCVFLCSIKLVHHHGQERPLFAYLASPVDLYCVAHRWHLRWNLDLVAGTMMSRHLSTLMRDDDFTLLLTIDACCCCCCCTQPFEAVFGFVKQITAFLEKLITWPRECGQGKFQGQQQNSLVAFACHRRRFLTL